MHKEPYFQACPEKRDIKGHRALYEKGDIKGTYYVSFMSLSANLALGKN